jgi:hypothetical protein
MAKRQILRDAIGVGGVDDCAFAEAAKAFGVFSLRQMPAAGFRAHDFSGAGDFEPLGHGFLGFDAFRTSHKIISIAKERGIYPTMRLKASANFKILACVRFELWLM